MRKLYLINSPSLLPQSTHLGTLYLRVHDLKTLLPFYTKVLNLSLKSKDEQSYVLGTPHHDILHLTQDKEATLARNATGLYHFALKYDTEADFATVVQQLFKLRIPNSPTDHGYSKSTYLTDPEGNTIELYVRTPSRSIYVENEGEWEVHYSDGSIGNGRDPLNLDELFSTIVPRKTFESIHPSLGHLHLYGNGNKAMTHFYKDILGFGEGVNLESFKLSDMSLSESQYHVIAFNEWKGLGIKGPHSKALGIEHYTLVVTESKTLDEIKERLTKHGVSYDDHGQSIYLKDPSEIKLNIVVQA